MKSIKTLKLNKCDIKILHILKSQPKELFDIHDQMQEYSDQEVSLNLSWLEKKNFIKKNVFRLPLNAGNKVTYSLDDLGKNFFSNKN